MRSEFLIICRSELKSLHFLFRAGGDYASDRNFDVSILNDFRR